MKHINPKATVNLTASALATSDSKRAALRIGVISDIQYADVDDGFSVQGVPRYYRGSIEVTDRAVAAWLEQCVDCAIHLGDILDIHQPRERSSEALDKVLTHLSKLNKPMKHIIGNHCLYNLPRAVLNARLGINSQGIETSYYSWSPHANWRFIVLDTFDLSIWGWSKDHPKHGEAVEILARRNPNPDKNDTSGLQGYDKRFVAFGGGVSQQQLMWLRHELLEARQHGQRVVIWGHVPLCPGTAPHTCLVWNYQEVLAELHRAGSGVVVATLSGHTHRNGYVQDEHGIHHLVLPGVVEAPPGRDAFGVLELWDDKLVLQGADICMSINMAFAPAVAVAP